jgi:hypothetical protein
VLVVAGALVLIAADLHVHVYHATRADEGNAAYTALRHAPRGRLLDLPVFLPDIHLNSIYLYYDMTAQRQRPTGYSTLAPRSAFATARRLRTLNCGDWSPQVARLGIRYIAFHTGLYKALRPHCLARAQTALERRGFQRLATDGAITVWAVRP